MRRRSWPIVIACVAIAPVAAAIVLLVGHDVRRAEAARPLFARDQDYVGASACRACHPDRYASWRRTFHSSMTQLPDERTVRGRFDGQAVTLFGATATPYQRDGKFFFQLPATGGQGPREAEVALCVGSRRYQQYFERTDGPDGTVYRRLPLLWHMGEARWLHINGVFLEPDDEDNWSPRPAVWNVNCVFCHNTGIAPGLKPVGDNGDKRFDTHVADVGIACESCHGPGRDHVALYSSPLARYRAELASAGARAVVDPLRVGQAESAALCGQCHAQRLPDPMEKLWTFLDTGPTFRPGGLLAGHVRPLARDLPVPPPGDADMFKQRFWSDGTARLTAYEYVGLMQSPCFRGGQFSCTSCHTMHAGDAAGQIAPDRIGDRACTQCHAAIARDIGAHTHHAPASSGSRCVECHMPRIVYGVLEIHPSHRVEVPDVARDVEGGRPNACTLCHSDRDAAWAADRMRDFWGARYRRPGARPDGAPLDAPEALVSAHAGDPLQRAVYVTALGRADSAVPAAARGFMLANALVGLGDGYGAVRFLARRSARALAKELDRSLEPGISDDLTAYDVQAARAARDPALQALLQRFAAAAHARLPPPPAGAFVTRDYHLQIDRIRPLLGLQQSHVISVGE
jgi:predicted CXXCH cytochrome family protein